MEERYGRGVNISLEAKEALSSYADRTGTVQIKVLSKLILWFTRLDATARAAILEEVEDPDRPAIAEAALRRLVDGDLTVVYGHQPDAGTDKPAAPLRMAGKKATPSRRESKAKRDKTPGRGD